MKPTLREASTTDGAHPEPLKDQIDDLMWNIKSTAGSRFAAAKRLEKRDRSLTSLTAFTSAYIIVLTVLPYILSTPQNLSDRVNLATVAMAVILLVSSLLQYSSGDIVNAEQYHRSALELNELRREVKALRSEITPQRFLEYSARYSRILEKYSVNHDDVDYLRFKLENVRYFNLSRLEVTLTRLRLFLSNSLPFAALAIVTVMCLGLGYYALTADSTNDPAIPKSTDISEVTPLTEG